MIYINIIKFLLFKWWKKIRVRYVFVKFSHVFVKCSFGISGIIKILEHKNINLNNYCKWRNNSPTLDFLLYIFFSERGIISRMYFFLLNNLQIISKNTNIMNCIYFFQKKNLIYKDFLMGEVISKIHFLKLA